MAHDPAWHAEYLRLENEAAEANAALRIARRALEYKRRPANAQATYDAALDAARKAGAARWEFEMSAAKITDTATLAPADWLKSLRPAHMR